MQCALGSVKLFKMMNVYVIHHNLCNLTVAFSWALYDAFGPGAEYYMYNNYMLWTAKLR